MYSPAEQRNTPLIAGNVKYKIVSFFSSKFLFWYGGEKTTVEEY